MSEILEHTIDNAQKITLGQVDNGTLATAVVNEDALAIMRHGKVKAYVVPEQLMSDLLMHMTVIQSDLDRVLSDQKDNQRETA